MNRIDNRTHQRNVMLAAAVYVAVVLLIWPLARTTPSTPLRLLFALAPLPPVIYIIWMVARRILHADELEQRTHLIGLGVAAAAASLFSLIGGFLAAAKVLSPEACAGLLLSVFAVLGLTYSAVRSWAARRYGSDGVCDDGFPLYQRLLGSAGMFCIVAVWQYVNDKGGFPLVLSTSLTAAFALAGLFSGVRRWRRAPGRHE